MLKYMLDTDMVSYALRHFSRVRGLRLESWA